MKQKWNCLAQASIHTIKFTIKFTSRIRYIHERRNIKEVGKMGTLLTSITKMKPRYIGVWLKDQLSRPDWFRNMFVNRSAWGAFSIYAHAKRSDGKSKISYKNKTKAEKAAFDMAKRYGYPFITYKCLFCDGWHVSKAVKRNTEGKTLRGMIQNKQDCWKVSRSSEMKKYH